jgi:endonuclease/exonuclease/phosphatase family metal-dependent hydrolase
MFDGRKLNLMNLHLLSAATNMKLHQLNCWREHIKNHTLRRIELSSSLAGLRQYGSHPRFPTIVAGDFNAPANDSVHRIMRKEFTDSFDAVGTGWGNTFHRVLPLLRIDYIYGSAKLIPVRSQTFTRHKTDHRMVVSDFIYR